MPRPTNVSARAKTLQRLREAEGKYVSDAELCAAAGVSVKSLKVHVHYLRDMGFKVGRAYRHGYFYCVDGVPPMDAPPVAVDEMDETCDGRDWRPEHRDDPLLAALRRAHPELV